MVNTMPKKYYARIIENELDQMLGIFGAVLIEGPKWCGKTTTAGTRAATRLLLMDPSRNFENRFRAETDPALAVSGEVPRLIDEWQEVPKLWDAARFECDNRGGEPGQFIFTGSATPRDNERPMHSGAGRFAKLRMDTMTLFELGKSSGAVKLSGIISGEKFRGAFGSMGSAEIAERIVCGGWPASIGRDARIASATAKRYIEIVAEEDIPRVDGSRRDPEKVKAVIASLARNESTLATLKTLVADLGGDVSRQTAASYISLLSRLSFVCDIPAWNPAMRSPVHLREARKHHLADPSLAAAALGATVETLLSDFKTLGLLFESLALHDLWVYARANGMGLYHYHDSRDLEVDAVIAAPGGMWIPVEVKLSSAQIEEASDNLVAVEERMVAAGNTPPVSKVAIIGFGSQAYVTDRGVQVVPLDVLAP